MANSKSPKVIRKPANSPVFGDYIGYLLRLPASQVLKASGVKPEFDTDWYSRFFNAKSLPPILSPSSTDPGPSTNWAASSEESACPIEDREIIANILASDSPRQGLPSTRSQSMPQQRVFVKNWTVRTAATGSSRRWVGHDLPTHQLEQESVEVDFTVGLPSGTDPNDFLNELKSGSFGTHSDSQEAAAARRRMEAQAQVATKKLAEAEEALLQMRARMAQAVCMVQSHKTAVEVYSQVLDRWASKLAEGATFTAAEGQELARTLADMLQFIGIAREVLREENPEVAEKRAEQLF